MSTALPLLAALARAEAMAFLAEADALAADDNAFSAFLTAASALLTAGVTTTAFFVAFLAVGFLLAAGLRLATAFLATGFLILAPGILNFLGLISEIFKYFLKFIFYGYS
ncbi:MAG TPA: hypothetical protein VIM85_06300 [Pseudomonadales bacterium]